MRTLNRDATGFVLAVQAVLAVAVLVFVVRHTDIHLPFVGGSRFELTAEFTDAGGLSATNRPAVLVSGVPSGRVASVTYADGAAHVKLSLDEDVRGLVYRDARARVTGRSAINDLIVDIEPGTRAAGPMPADGVIVPSRTSGPVGSDRVVDTLDADTRAYLAVMIGQLREGLGPDSSALARAIGELDAFAGPATALTQALAARRTLLTRLVDESSDAFAVLAGRGDQIREAITAGRAILDTTSAAAPQVDAAIRALPTALGELRGALDGVNRLAVPLAPALAGLRPDARSLPQALRSTRATLPVADRLLGSLDQVARTGRPQLHDLRRALAALGPASTALLPGARALPGVLGPLAANAHGIGELGQNFSGVFSTNDANGPLLRGLGFVEPVAAEDFGLSSLDQRARLDVAGAFVGACLTVNPAACLVGVQVPGLQPQIESLVDGIRRSPLAPLKALATILDRRGAWN